MNGAIFDSTFGIFFKLKIAKTYDAVLATPLGVRDVAIGELTWSLIRGTLYSIAFLVVMAALGLVASFWAVLCLPAAMLVSFAFGGVGMFGTCYMRSWQDFDLISLAIVPLFLFSGVFYPLSLYPSWLRLVVTFTPFTRGSPCCAVSTPVPSVRCSLCTRDISALLGVIGLFGATRRLGRLLLA